MPVPLPQFNQRSTTDSNEEPNEESLSTDVRDEQLFLQDKLFMLISSFHFTDTIPLRALMRRTGAIISGSAALAIIHPHQFIPNDIDFYVLPHGFPAVLKYVEDHGYKIKPYDQATLNYFHQNIVVVRLVHPISRQSVNVTTGLVNHVVKLVTRFHSTLVMNYIAWFGLVVLYPEWTLRKVSLIITNTLIARECFMKYVDRGYTFHRHVFDLPRPLEGHVCRVDPYCPTTRRSLYDGHCLVEPFEGDGFQLRECERDMTWFLPILCSV